MKRISRSLILASVLALSTLAAFADDLAKIEGKWSVKKKNEDGQAFTQVLEINKDKFKFAMVGGENQTFLYAEGDLKLVKYGPFSAVKFVNIKAGASADQTESIDDDHEAIYWLEGDTWTLATNFDRSRDNQKPTADPYVRAKK